MYIAYADMMAKVTVSKLYSINLYFCKTCENQALKLNLCVFRAAQRMRRKRKRKGKKRLLRYAAKQEKISITHKLSLDCKEFQTGTIKYVLMVLSRCVIVCCFSGKGDGKAEDPVPAGAAACPWGR